MASLMDLYNEMSKDQQESLGKSSSTVKTPGCHLAEITSMMVIDGTRVKVDFKTETGQTIDYTGFLTNKDPAKVEATVTRVMNQLAQMCTAAGMKLQNVLSKSVNGTVEYKTGTKPTEEYPAIKGKKLYITTTTVIEGDEKDATKCYVKQEIDVFKFFDIKKRNGLEIASDADEGVTLEAADAEAKKTFAVHYKHTANKACQTKLAELTSGQYTANATPTYDAASISDDDI